MRRMLICLFSVAHFAVGVMSAQAKFDYNWILGYITGENNPENYFGGVRFDFNKVKTSPDYFETQCFSNGVAVISSAVGEIKAYSDGCRIYNRHNQVMFGGDTIAYGLVWDIYHDYGYPTTQCQLFLPFPGDASKYVLFYVRCDDTFEHGYLLFAVVQFDDNFPDGHVVSKDSVLLSCGIRSLVTAVKHANGIDWWVILPEDGSSKIFKVLLSDKGPEIIGEQTIGKPWNPKENASQCAFTPDGTKYVRFNGWKGLDIFEFDRCTGQFSNPVESGPISEPVIVGGGVAVSPNSRYLYVTNIYKLYQYDLKAENILSSRILIDTFDGYGDPFPNTFYQMALAPDGKIYMFSSNSKKALHVIVNPNSAGKACNFKQHLIKLPANIFFSANNIPYFRLGPVDGTSCDTLGLNNEPVAYFKYEADSLDTHRFLFRNLSYFEPEVFNWDFGNGDSSPLEDPAAITYLADGTYTICLTASNSYGSDEYCQTITVGDSVVQVDHIEDGAPTVYPNPFTCSLSVKSPEDSGQYFLTLLDLLGHEVGHFQLTQAVQEIPLPSLPSGLYMYTITNAEYQVVKTGRVVKVE